MTGLSGNEMFCLGRKGYAPGELIIGNSVYSLGFLGALGAGLQSVFGGEVSQITRIISDGRHESEARLLSEARKKGATGITSMTSELRTMQGNAEFLSVGSCIHDNARTRGGEPFSTACNGQDLYCLLDCGYTPGKFVIGNVAYSVGLGGGIMGALKSFGRGEVREFSDIFNETRHLALARIVAEAAGASAVVGIETRIAPFGGAHEMLMIGTAATHPALPEHRGIPPVTSDLTCEEMWSIASMGYMPLKLVLGTAVYSLGLIGGLKALLKGLARGEVHELTTLVYDAREHAIGLIKAEAEAIGADDVVGIKTHIHEFGGLLEFMAIGTAVKRNPGAKPHSDALPAQAVVRDRDTWFGGNDMFSSALTAEQGES